MKRFLLILTTILVLGAVFAGGAAAQTLDPEPYRIQPGDTLSSIAREYCTTWQDVFRYNQGYIGDDPNALRVGTLIFVIDRCNENSVYDRGARTYANGTVNGPYYTIVAGDTLYSIGQRFGLHYQVIMDANGLDSTAVMNPGQQLLIPGLNVGHIQPAVDITSPLNGSVFHAPYTAVGTGQGLHEGNVVVRLLDSNGDLMVQQETVLQGADVATGGFGTWQVTFYNVYGRPGTNGSIEAFSPETGATDVVYFLFSGY